MGFKQGFRDGLKPVLGVTRAFVAFTFLFVGLYVFFEHKTYLSDYKRVQQEEINTLQEKTKTSLEHLTKLSELTSKRLASSQGEVQRIQNILISVPRLSPDHTFPKIQKVSYHKLTPPEMTITRFGMLPLDPTLAPQREATQGDKTSIAFDKNAVIGKAMVLNSEGEIEGILEIELDLLEFQASLGTLQTLAFSPSEGVGHLIHNMPFAIYGKSFKNFWGFAAENKFLYAMFLFYMSFCLIFLPGAVYYLDRRRKNNQRREREALEMSHAQLTAKVGHQDDIIQIHEQNQESQQISNQSYQEVRSLLSNRQKAGTTYITRSLDVLEQSFFNPNIHLSEAEFIEIIRSCRKESRPLSYGSVSEVKNEAIDIKDMLEHICELFTAKIHASNLMVNIVCPKTVPFSGDPFFIQFLLITLIGKPIYRAPKNGKIVIRVKTQKMGLYIEVQDNNGLPYSEKAERLIKKSFDLFMTQDEFQQSCQDHGLTHMYSKDNKGFNVNKIVIPASSDSAEMSGSNVVPLFK